MGKLRQKINLSFGEDSAIRSLAINDKAGMIVAAHTSGKVTVLNYDSKTSELSESYSFEAHEAIITKLALNFDKKWQNN